CVGYWLDSQILHDSFSRLAAFEHGGDDEVRAADHVAPGEHLRVRRLKARIPRRADSHAAVRVHGEPELLEPVGGARPEAERDDHGVGRQHLLGAGHHLGAPPTTRTGRPEPRLHHLDAFHLVLAHDLDGLAVEEEAHALFLAVHHLATRPRHVFLVAPIDASHALRALADGRAVAVHAGVEIGRASCRERAERWRLTESFTRRNER